MAHSRLLLLSPLALIAGALGAPAEAAQVSAATFRITLAEPGVYRVTYQDLVRAGGRGPWPSVGLGMRNQGRPVPIWVRDGGDGMLGEGDWIEFVGEMLPGETSYYNEYTSRNVYVLGTDETKPARMERGKAPPRPPSRDPRFRSRCGATSSRTWSCCAWSAATRG